MSERIEFEGKKYLETSEGSIRCGDLKISKGFVTFVRIHGADRHPYIDRPGSIETKTHEISAKYYRESPPTFEEWIANESNAHPLRGTFENALRSAFEAGQKLGKAKE